MLNELVKGYHKLVMGPGQIFVGQVESGLACVWVKKISPLKCQIFQFFALRVKKISSDRVKKYPGQSQVSHLFTVRVGSGQGQAKNLISTLN